MTGNILDIPLVIDVVYFQIYIQSGELHMRRYETVFVVNSDLKPDEMENVFEKFKGIIALGKGHIIKFDKWGMRDLAYRVGKHFKGYYVLMDFAGEANIVKELERNLKIDDRIIRYLTVKISDKFETVPPEEEVAA